jgi:acyl-[acyl carrier protein]--UDP-N-acetylglucosamine O-acyltransferase
MVAATIHPTAIVDAGAQLGEGCRVWHFAHICGGARIGKGCSFGQNQNVFVGNDVLIGDNVKIQNNVSVYDAVELEDSVFCGPSMVFTTVYTRARRSRARTSTGVLSCVLVPRSARTARSSAASRSVATPSSGLAPWCSATFRTTRSSSAFPRDVSDG